MRLFCKRFGKRAQPSTLHCKATHLYILCDHAEAYFRRAKRPQEAARALHTAMFLRGFASSSQKGSSREAANRQELERRVADDFVLRATRALDGLLSTFIEFLTAAEKRGTDHIYAGTMDVEELEQ